MLEQAARATHGAGYVVRRGFFTDAQVAELHHEVHRLETLAASVLADVISSGDASRLSSGDLVVVPEASDPAKVCRYESIRAASPWFDALVAGRLGEAVSQAAGTPVVLFKDKMNEKNPGGGAFPPHQDFSAYRHFPPSYNITAMISVDAMTPENGCLSFSPNYRDVAADRPDLVETVSAGLPLFRYYQGGARNGDIVDEASKLLDWEMVAAEPGDIVIFDSFVPHCSQINHSAKRRRALFFTFSRASEGDWYADYYRRKRGDRDNPIFHVSTPTKHK